MRFPKKLAVIAVIAIAASSASSARAEKVKLQLNLAKGDQKNMAMDTDMNTHTAVNGQNFDMKMKMNMDMTFDVKDVDAQGVYTIATTQTHAAIDMKSPMMNMAYDSNKPEDANSPIGQQMGAMIKKPVTMKMDRSGKVQDVTADGQAPAEVKAQAAGMKDSMGQMFNGLPDKPVDVGDTWTAQYKMPGGAGGAPMTVDAKYTLKDRKNGVAFIQFDGTLNGGDGGLKGTMNGVIQIDEKSGWTKQSTMDMKMTGKQMGADMTMDGKVTTTSK